MWQFIYSTGKLYGLDRNWYVDERRDPEKATRAACEYLIDLYEQFDNWYLALGAYNSGSGRITRAQRLHQTSDFWQLHSLPRETRNYVPFFLAASIIGKDPAKYGFNMPENNPWKYEIVEIEKSADLSILAQSAGISLKTLKQYNPELRQSATPTTAYQLKLPVGKTVLFEKNYAALPESKRFAPQYVRHRVRSGENLGSISRKYRVSIHDIASVNRIRNRHKIKVGQVLTIPVRGQTSASYASNTASRPSGTTKQVYTVRKGDTLGQIAESYKVLAREIRSWNGLKYGEYIYPGQKLILWIKRS
jgi:membrane-bound lytic murein transglycosylase D